MTRTQECRGMGQGVVPEAVAGPSARRFRIWRAKAAEPPSSAKTPPACRGRLAAARGCTTSRPPRSVLPPHPLERLARVEHAVLAGVPLDGRMLLGRRARRHWAPFHGPSSLSDAMAPPDAVRAAACRAMRSRARHCAGGRTAHKAAQSPRPVHMRQDAYPNAAGAPASAGIPAVEVPRAGERFTDEELGARYGVPLRGGIRVSRANRCIVLVRPERAGSGHAGTERGAVVAHTGQDADPEGVLNQQMSGVNLDLSRSREDGRTVLYFTRKGTDLVFNSRVECASHGFEVEMNCRGQPRVVVKFELEAVGGQSDPAPVNKMESLGCPLLAGLEEAKLHTETIGEYVARMANAMEPGLCTQKDVEEMDDDFRRLARGEYCTLDDLFAELDRERG